MIDASSHLTEQWMPLMNFSMGKVEKVCLSHSDQGCRVRANNKEVF